MTDQFTSLSPAALRDIIANIDGSLQVFADQPEKLNAMEARAKVMLIGLRAQLVDQLENHPDYLP